MFLGSAGWSLELPLVEFGELSDSSVETPAYTGPGIWNEQYVTFGFQVDDYIREP